MSMRALGLAVAIVIVAAVLLVAMSRRDADEPAAEPDVPAVVEAPPDDAPVDPIVPAPLDLPELDTPRLDLGTPPDPLAGEVMAGDNLSKILARAGLPAATALELADALAPTMDPTALRVGQRFELELDDAGGLRKFVLRRSVTEAVRVDVDEAGTYLATVDTTATDVREEEIGGTIESSLWGALVDRGHPAAMVDVMVDAFAYDIDFFTATRKGDRFRLIVERHEVDGEFVRYGKVLAAEYDGDVAKARMFWWRPDPKRDGVYVDDEGRGIERTLLKTPLKYARVSSGFDPARMHPVLHRVKSHRGVDYAAPEGTPVWASAPGTIVFRGKQGGAGNMVILRHDGGLKTLYMHLSRFADGQRVGQHVAAKTVIGYVGQTGLATGPHLHYGVQKAGHYVDPQKVDSTRKAGVARSDRRRFAAARDAWLARLAAIAVE